MATYKKKNAIVQSEIERRRVVSRSAKNLKNFQR